MGSRAVRITREDFLTPPEFGSIELAKHGAGRIGGVRFELKQTGGRTCLGSSYDQIPLRMMPPFDLDGEPAALVYLITLTAGLMDGDAHRLEIDARRGTRAVVTGQSATRVHPAVESFATQQWSVRVEDDACLVVLPGPTIPFRGARYYQRGRVELAPTARLIWGDIWFPGRYERGPLSERFEFERIVQDFEVRRTGELVYRDRFRWDGPWDAEAIGWYTGGALATASLFVGGPMPARLAETENRLRRAVFPLAAGDSCIRWCGEPGAVVSDLVRTALSIAADWTIAPGAPPWLLESSSLAPNHWFSVPA